MKKKQDSKEIILESLTADVLASMIMQGLNEKEKPKNIQNLDDTLIECEGVKLFRMTDSGIDDIMNAALLKYHTANGTYYIGEPGVQYKPGKYYSIATVLNKSERSSCHFVEDILTALIDNKIIALDKNVPAEELIDRSELLKRIIFSSAYSNIHMLVSSESIAEVGLESMLNDLNFIMAKEYDKVVRDFYINEICESPYRITCSTKIGTFYMYVFRTKGSKPGEIVPNEHIKIRKFLKGGK